jgi:proteasome lid subunit RPN8/RPN11
MRWTEKPADLPLQPLSALRTRAPALSACAPSTRGLLVIVMDDVREEVLRHLRGSQDEHGGLLLGEVFAADESVNVAASRAVMISQAIPALDFASSGISLRMESGVWERARIALRPLELIVGWYHSHPGLGAFFSGTDRRTQRAFFPHAYSVGWVVDPLRGEAAVFVGAESEDPARVVYCAGAAPSTGGAAAGGGDDACGAEGAGA